MGRCHNCRQELIEIDNRGERLTGQTGKNIAPNSEFENVCLLALSGHRSVPNARPLLTHSGHSSIACDSHDTAGLPGYWENSLVRSCCG